MNTVLVLTLCDSVDCSPPAPLSMKFSMHEYWSRLPFPSPGDLPNPRIVSFVSCIAGGFLLTEPSRKPCTNISIHNCCCSVPKLYRTLCDPMDCSTPGFPILHVSQSLFRFMSNELVILSNHQILCCPLLLLPSILTSIRVFSNELTIHIRWPKY